MGTAEPARDQQRLECQSPLERIGAGSADAGVCQGTKAEQELALVEQAELIE